MNESEPAKRQKERRSREQIHQLCEEWRASGLTRTAFCKRKGLGVSLFCRWLKHQDTLPIKKMKFLPVTKIPSSESVMKLEIELPQGIVLRFFQLPEINVIRDLMVGLQHVARHSQ